MRCILKVALASLCLLITSSAMSQQPFKPVPEWLSKAVFYQVYPQSFKDTDGDGIGDLNGIVQQLDYIKWLGCNTIWLNPCFESAFQDAGYDVIDFYKVAKRYGTNDDLVRLFREAHKRKMRVCIDLVAGHTSIESPWFKESQKRERNEYSDRYIWTPDSTIKPEKHVSGKFERNGTYRKNFFDCQPALNYGFGEPDPACPWEQPTSAEGPTKTRQELMRIMDYWMDKGCDGFRVDLASSLVKKDPNLVETNKLWAEVRTHFQNRYPEGILLAEWGNPMKAIKAGFMMDFIIQFGGSGYNELFFNKEGVFRRDTCYFSLEGNGSPKKFIDNIRKQLDSVGANGYVCIPTANHDFQRPRSGSRNTDEQLKCVMAFLFTMPGVPLVYYGDEIGMRYISGLPNKEGSVVTRGNRAGSRTPMQWSRATNAGFSTAPPEMLYLPIDTLANFPTVEVQRNDQNSLLSFTRSMLKLRAKYPALASGGDVDFLTTQEKAYPLVYTRGKDGHRFLVIVNPTGKPQSITISNTIKVKKFEAVLNQNTSLKIENGNFEVKADATSYGVYRLRE